MRAPRRCEHLNVSPKESPPQQHQIKPLGTKRLSFSFEHSSNSPPPLSPPSDAASLRLRKPPLLLSSSQLWALNYPRFICFSTLGAISYITCSNIARIEPPKLPKFSYQQCMTDTPSVSVSLSLSLSLALSLDVRSCVQADAPTP